jgi:hypothetical protein
VRRYKCDARQAINRIRLKYRTQLVPHADLSNRGKFNMSSLCTVILARMRNTKT